MKKVILGKTGLEVTKTAMGCLPVQRCSEDDGVKLIRAAYEGGINFFDTANAYTDSEMKVGRALSDVRGNVIIATKSQARDKAGCAAHIENSLKMLRTDYIDLFQFHNCEVLPDINDPDDAFAAVLEARDAGKIRHIGITTHRITVAEAAIASGCFETLMFPFSYISADRDLALADKCMKADMGFIAMKGLAGGMLTNARACRAFMGTYRNVVPIWGIQKMSELQEWLDAEREDVKLTPELQEVIAKDRRELAGSFCRSCGYCMPCPAGIEIRNCARMNMLLRRSPWKQYYTPEWRAKMEKINDCLECRQCASKCPYKLDTPNVLKYMLKDYNEFYEAHKDEL
jgi:aryl-alcohol dehydrogenase-like predicted oxidoreductase